MFDPSCHLARSCGFFKFYHLVFLFVLEKLLVSRTSFVLLVMNLLPSLAMSCQLSHPCRGCAGVCWAGCSQYPLAWGKPWAGASPPCSIAPKPLASSSWRVCSGSEPAEQDSCLLPATLAGAWGGMLPVPVPVHTWLLRGSGAGPLPWAGFDVAAWGDSAGVWLEMLSPKPGH